MKKRLLLALVLVLAVLASCAKSDNYAYRRVVASERLLKKEHRIKIAASGAWDKHVNYLMEGIQLALDEVNEAGGVLGSNVEVLFFDDENMLFTGNLAAYQIASDQQICAVLGHTYSSISIPNSIIYHFYGLLMFSPYATKPSLTQQGLPYVFRNIFDDNAAAIRAADFCAKKGWNRILIYYLNSEFGEGAANAFELNFGKISQECVVQDRVSYEIVNTTNDHTQVAKKWLDDYEFDAVFVAGVHPDIHEIVPAFRSMGITQPIIDFGEFDSPVFFQQPGNEDEDNVYTVSQYNAESNNPKYVAFRKAFKAKYGVEPDIGALHGYDALKVLTKAMETAKSIHPKDVAKTLRSVEEWDEGAGPYRFDEKGDITNCMLYVKKAANGVFKVIE
jgi:branched-chain amino acid transport system substrate-binding protein